MRPYYVLLLSFSLLSLLFITPSSAKRGQNENGNENTPASEAKQRKQKIKKVVLRLADFQQSNIGSGSMLRLWNNFKTKHNKTYETIDEEVHRIKVYFINLWRILKHNREAAQGKHTFKMRINQYGDLTHKEFVKTMNGFKRKYGDSLAKGHGSSFLEPLNLVMPKSVDWRDHGYVTPVKNQGHCGSCWSFSATGSLEGQHFRKTGKLVALSEQNLVDCSKSFGNDGCEGGLMDQAFQYVKANDGIDTEDSYPYEAEEETCRFKRGKVGAMDTGFVDVDRENETALKQAVASVGPVSVAIDASHQSFQFYSEGRYLWKGKGKRHFHTCNIGHIWSKNF